jgi:glyoxylase-like metal-dependent hydrolase (beta-lactamase superfamily II)
VVVDACWDVKVIGWTYLVLLNLLLLVWRNILFKFHATSDYCIGFGEIPDGFHVVLMFRYGCGSVQGIRAIVAKDNMKLVGAIVTHYHFDHVGGTPPPPFDSLGITVPGVYELAMEDKVQVYINKEDADHVKRKNKIPDGSMVLVEDSTVLNVGSIELHFIHTPGHTAGSQCIYIPRGDEGVLLAGDTLFAGSCGRLDFPDCDPKAMFHSLQKKLATLPESTKVYSGHNYGDPCTSIAAEKKRGQLKPVNESHWLKYHHEF